jgi:hypothetical protein
MENGQRLKGWVDLLVDVGDGWILVDHKSFPGGREECSARALEHSGQLWAYRQAVEQASGRPVLGQWIHFCVSGLLVEVFLQPDRRGQECGAEICEKGDEPSWYPPASS